MTATAADIGYNTRFGIEGLTPGTYVNVAEVVSIAPPNVTRDTVEATHLQSPNSWKEYIAGLKDAGEASFTLNYVPSATEAMLAAFDAERGNYQITFPNGVMLRFAGIFTSYSRGELTPEGKMEASVTIKATGAVTMHAAV